MALFLRRDESCVLSVLFLSYLCLLPCVTIFSVSTHEVNVGSRSKYLGCHRFCYSGSVQL